MDLNGQRAVVTGSARGRCGGYPKGQAASRAPIEIPDIEPSGDRLSRWAQLTQPVLAHPQGGWSEDEIAEATRPILADRLEPVSKMLHAPPAGDAS